MFRINNKIKIEGFCSDTHRVFRNEEINSFLNNSFKCCKCGYENQFIITPYETGFSFLEIYENEKILTEKEILENKIATRTSKWMSHLGKFTVSDLPTLYFGVACKKCLVNYMVVFCYGEKQPGLTILEISGVWYYLPS